MLEDEQTFVYKSLIIFVGCKSVISSRHTILKEKIEPKGKRRCRINRKLKLCIRIKDVILPKLPKHSWATMLNLTESRIKN